MDRSHQPLTATPSLERALRRLRSSLVLLVLVHGLGTVLSVAAAWLVFAFVADWGLHVPRPVRLAHAVVLVGLPLWFLWRDGVRLLLRIPRRAGLAVLLERAHPEHGEVLVSAVQFQESGDVPAASGALVQEVYREAERRAAALEPRRVLDPKPPAARLFAGLTCAAATALLLAQSERHAAVFFARMLGSEVPWPRRTHLSLELSGLPDVRREDGVIAARVARGSDVPVLVRATGIAPEEVVLHFADGNEDVLARGSGDTYRRVLRALDRDVELWVTGGDDDDREPLVRLTVLQPPDVAGIAVRVRPPAYSRLPEELLFNRDVQVLAGSTVTVHVLTDPPDARGIARVLPADVELSLVPTPYPVDAAAAPESPSDARAEGLSFELVAERSLRYRFELVDDDGLSNPDPGLFKIDVVDDRAPEVSVLAPGRSEVETVAGGSLALRVRVKDDFGLSALSWRTADARGGEGGESGALAEQDLVWRPLPSGAAREHLALSSRRLAVRDLFGGEVAEGSQCTLEVVALDDRRPEPGEGRSSPLRVRVVSGDELLRRVQDRLAQARAHAAELLELASEKKRRVDELTGALAPGLPLESGDARAVSTALNGQRLVRADADSVARELAAVADTVLYAHLDEKAEPLLDRLDALSADVADRAFRSDVWAALVAEYEGGTLGSAGLAGNLIEMVGLALAVSERHSLAAEEALERAQAAVGGGAVRAALAQASGEQALAIARLEDLLERLAEWDSFQSVLSLTRDILNRQTTLKERTKRFASEK